MANNVGKVLEIELRLYSFGPQKCLVNVNETPKILVRKKIGCILTP